MLAKDEQPVETVTNEMRDWYFNELPATDASPGSAGRKCPCGVVNTIWTGTPFASEDCDVWILRHYSHRTQPVASAPPQICNFCLTRAAQSGFCSPECERRYNAINRFTTQPQSEPREQYTPHASECSYWAQNICNCSPQIEVEQPQMYRCYKCKQPFLPSDKATYYHCEECANVSQSAEPPVEKPVTIQQWFYELPQVERPGFAGDYRACNRCQEMICLIHVSDFMLHYLRSHFRGECRQPEQPADPFTVTAPNLERQQQELSDSLKASIANIPPLEGQDSWEVVGLGKFDLQGNPLADPEASPVDEVVDNDIEKLSGKFLANTAPIVHASWCASYHETGYCQRNTGAQAPPLIAFPLCACGCGNVADPDVSARLDGKWYLWSHLDVSQFQRAKENQ